MNPRDILALIVSLIAAIGLTWYEGYAAGSDKVRAQWYAERQQLTAGYAAKLKQAEEQHDNDQALIDRLHDDAGRVRVHLPACPAAAATAGNPDLPAGAFSARVDDDFARLQQRAGELFRDCDQLNIDARRANGTE